MRDPLTLQYSDPNKACQHRRNEETTAPHPLDGRRTQGARSRQLLHLFHGVATRFDYLSTNDRCLLEHHELWLAPCVRAVPSPDILRYSQTPRIFDVDVATRYFVGSPRR